jgi:hypothetical protein
MPFAEINFDEFLLIVLEFFLLFAWLSILFMVIGDLFRDHQLSGVAKAVWVFFLIFVLWFGVLVYLIIRGHGMQERKIKEQGSGERRVPGLTRGGSAFAPRRPLVGLLFRVFGIPSRGAGRYRGRPVTP